MAAVLTRTATSIQKTSDDANDVLIQWKYISYKARRLMNRVEDKIVAGTLFKLF
jgi:hypothetical protein